MRSKATFSLLFSLLSFLWKRQFKRREKSEKIKVKRTKRNDNLPKENCRFFLSMGYKKDIFAVFAYEFELSHCYLSLSGIYRGSSSRPPGVQPSSDSVIFFLASFSFDCALASEIKSSILLYCFNTIPSSEAKVSR